MSSAKELLLISATLVVLGAGCQGAIHGPFEDRDPAHEEQRAIDDQQRAENPQLFETALAYFPGQSPAPAAQRLYRLTRTQLDLTTKTLLPSHHSISALQTLPRDPLEKNYEYAQNLGFSPANFTPYTTWVGQIAESVRARPESVIDCAASGNSPACLEQQTEAFVARAFRGIVSDTQLGRYRGLFTSSVAGVGFANATADLVDVTLSSPSYVFRDEVLTDSESRLLPAQRLQNITYTLADAPPESLGLSTQAASELNSAEAVQRTVEHVLATAEARAKLVRFFSSWLEVREPEEFGISTSVYPEFTPEVAVSVVNETQSFLERQLSVAAPKLKDLTESTQASISDATAFLYGQSASGSLVELDPAKRLGIFTQPAVIASHSGPTTTRLVKRGVFFTRKIMCLQLGTPPEDVDTTVPTTPGATERQRIETVTAPAKCAGCHAFINPFGFMQENFDAIGRWRTTDEGQPIDASISVNFLDEGPFSTASPVDALRGFTRSLRFQQCFTRQLFRFYTGRDEAEGDDPLLRQMFFNFANNGEQDIIGMLQTLASSSVFSLRSGAP